MSKCWRGNGSHTLRGIKLGQVAPSSVYLPFTGEMNTLFISQRHQPHWSKGLVLKNAYRTIWGRRGVPKHHIHWDILKDGRWHHRYHWENNYTWEHGMRIWRQLRGKVGELEKRYWCETQHWSTIEETYQQFIFFLQQVLELKNHILLLSFTYDHNWIFFSYIIDPTQSLHTFLSQYNNQSMPHTLCKNGSPLFP